MPLSRSVSVNPTFDVNRSCSGIYSCICIPNHSYMYYCISSYTCMFNFIYISISNYICICIYIFISNYNYFSTSNFICISNYICLCSLYP